MVRYGNMFYYKNEESKIRPQKEKSLLKERLNELETYKSILDKDKEKVNSPMYKNLLEKIEIVKAQIKLTNRLGKPIKRSYKKINREKLKDMIINYIKYEIIDKENIYVTKEEISRKFKVKEHEVERVFAILNREGMLSQRKSEYAHDTNRNLLLYGSDSGWHPDFYEVINKDRY